MLQISLFILVGISLFLVISVPFLFTTWKSGKKVVFSALTAWVSLVGITGFLNSTV